VLDDVAFRSFTEQPAGENPPPFIARMIEDDQLHKGTGLLRRFPLCGALTGAQADDCAADADAFTGFKRDIADEAVALVEEAKHRHPLRHRRYPGKGILFALGNRPHRSTRGRLIILGWRWRRLPIVRAAPATGQQQDACQRRQDKAALHAPSGVHG
jgi:hypothetical protein